MDLTNRIIDAFENNHHTIGVFINFFFLLFWYDVANMNILYCDKNFDSLFNVVNENLLKVCDSFKAKSLTVHSNKCNYIVFSKKLKCTDSMTANVRINPHSILRV